MPAAKNHSPPHYSLDFHTIIMPAGRKKSEVYFLVPCQRQISWCGRTTKSPDDVEKSPPHAPLVAQTPTDSNVQGNLGCKSLPIASHPVPRAFPQGWNCRSAGIYFVPKSRANRLIQKIQTSRHDGLGYHSNRFPREQPKEAAWWNQSISTCLCSRNTIVTTPRIPILSCSLIG